MAVRDPLRGESQCESDLIHVVALPGTIKELRTGIQELGPRAPSSLHARRVAEGHVEQSPVQVGGDGIPRAPIAGHDAGKLHSGLRKDAHQDRQRRIFAIDNLAPDALPLRRVERSEHDEIEVQKEYPARGVDVLAEEVVELHDLVAVLPVEVGRDNRYRMAAAREFRPHLLRDSFRTLQDDALGRHPGELLQGEQQILRLVEMQWLIVDHHRVAERVVGHQARAVMAKRRQSSKRPARRR